MSNKNRDNLAEAVHVIILIRAWIIEIIIPSRKHPEVPDCWRGCCCWSGGGGGNKELASISDTWCRPGVVVSSVWSVSSDGMMGYWNSHIFSYPLSPSLLSPSTVAQSRAESFCVSKMSSAMGCWGIVPIGCCSCLAPIGGWGGVLSGCCVTPIGSWNE